MSEDLLGGSAVAIARAVRAGVVSALEVVELHLERIASLNPRLNAIVTLCDEAARSAAGEADRKAGRGEHLGPLHGVPFTVKDAIATSGVRTTAGSRLLSEFVPSRSAPAIERLERAGAIMLGKTNCPEFALHTHTWNGLFGATLNPVDERVTPGGSSGGDSAAVASGCAAFGVGTDFGASTRWPAHCTGISTLRPTPGLIPMTGVLPFPASADPLPPPNSGALLTRAHSISPLTRSVGDLWSIVRVMAGPDGRDANTVPVALDDPASVDLESLGCCWFEGEGTYPVRADLVEVVSQAAAAMVDRGLRVRQEMPPGIEGAYPLYAALRDVDGLWTHAALATTREEELVDSNRELLGQLRPATIREYQQIAAEVDERRGPPARVHGGLADPTSPRRNRPRLRGARGEAPHPV